MKNLALLTGRFDFNEFTGFVYEQIRRNGSCRVILRDNGIVTVVYCPVTEQFYSNFNSMRWYPDGSSTLDYLLDMMETEEGL